MKKRGSTGSPLYDVRDYDELVSIWAAVEAKPSLLASRLRDGGASRVEMKVAADLIEGKIKSRRPKFFGRERRLSIAELVAFLEKLLPRIKRKPVARKVVISLAAEHHRVSERHVYNALEEFDASALAHCERLYRKSTGEVEEIKRNDELREMLKDTDHDTLLEIIEGLWASILERK